MLKKLLVCLIIIFTILISKSYATDEIISSQMNSLNLSSFTKEGEKYTKDVFPEIELEELLNSTIRGDIENNQIYKGILSLFGKEIVASISILGSVLIIVVVHSLLKSFSDNLNKGQSVSQIAYYIEYILIVTLVMTNFTSIINMIKESIFNLVGFVNSLIPILLALMSASRKYYFCYFYTTVNNLFCCVYCEQYNICDTSNFINYNNIRNNLKFIIKNTNR